MSDKHNRFDDDTKIWIWTSIKSGLNKRDVYDELLDMQYPHEMIVNELNYNPDDESDLGNGDYEEDDEFCDCDYCMFRSGKTKLYNANIQYDKVTRLDSYQIELYYTDDFMTTEECNRMINIIKDQLRPSDTTK